MISRRTDAQHQDRADVRSVGFGCAQLRHARIMVGTQALAAVIPDCLQSDPDEQQMRLIIRSLNFKRLTNKKFKAISPVPSK